MSESTSGPASDCGRAVLSALLLESIASSFTRPGTASGKAFRRFRETFNKVFKGHRELPEPSELKMLHRSLAQTDLDRLGHRSRVQKHEALMVSGKARVAWKELLQTVPDLEILTNLHELLRQLEQQNKAAWGLFFSTRPLGAAEINLLDPKTQLSLDRLCHWLRCMRGNRSRVEMPRRRKKSDPIPIRWASAPENPLVAITSFRTALRSWEARVKGTPDLTLARFNCLAKLVRTVCELDERPHYVVLPELSVPKEWILEIASLLQKSGISLIAGVEYEIAVNSKERLCHNPILMVLQSTDLGYRTYRLLRQDKTLPAPEEEADLHRVSNLVLRPKVPFDHGYLDDPDRARPVYQHGNLHFGVMICNELTNIAMRSSYRGRVDALFVAEWNKDLKTFAPLVEATASDVHCFVVQVNNRAYGDSRIRVPAKDDWKRDVVRLQGGENDYVVVGRLNVPELRQFQSNYRSPSGGNAEFKPVPTGFRMSQSRNDNRLLHDEDED